MEKKNFINLPSRALTNIDILKYAKLLKIPFFRGVFMRNSLPKDGPRVNESAVINLDNADGAGSHWVAYRKRKNNILYFDSFGNLKPPLDLVKYFKSKKILYNHERYQEFDTIICGHLCLKFLTNQLKK